MLRLLVGGKISHSFGRYTYKARIFRYGEFIHCCVKWILELRIETKSDEVDCTGCCWYDYSLWRRVLKLLPTSRLNPSIFQTSCLTTVMFLMPSFTRMLKFQAQALFMETACDSHINCLKNSYDENFLSTPGSQEMWSSELSQHIPVLTDPIQRTNKTKMSAPWP